jgi:NAD(P)-dependent dehydrogenase (short-subunit alcohol dehydrogenase family)
VDAPIDLGGRMALVTGAGRGIGRATALALASAGAEVAICARTPEELRDAAAEIRRTTSRNALARVTDVTDASAVDALFVEVRERWGVLDVVVNNAAMLGPVGRLVDVSADDWVTALAANVGSVAMVSRASIPLMTRGGSIVNLSGGGIGGPGVQERVSAYTASKGAVAVLTEVLAGELAPQGIRVNAVAPGAMATRFTEPILAAGPQRAGEGGYQTTLRQRAAPSSIDDFLRLMVWLASDRSAWLSGRLLSARWDSIDKLERLRQTVPGSSLLTLRRIDGELFAPVDRSGG